MTDKFATTIVYVLILLAVGFAVGLANRGRFSWRWLLVAGGLVAVNDLALTNAWGAIPVKIGSGDWNWQGKFLALAASLAIAAHPAFGFARAGITLRQKAEGMPLTYGVAVMLCLIFAAIALIADNEPTSPETLAFQLTMPGFEEETFYRGIFLLALNEAFRSRWRALGIDWGWGAVLSCLIFGLGHGLEIDGGAIAFDSLTVALSGGPALILIWLRERTGSIVLPVILHNFGNTISHVL